MATVSILLIIIGFIISVWAGVVLSLPMQTSSGELSQSKITLWGIIMSLSVIMVIAGVLGYYYLRGNLPYYCN